VEGNGPVVVNLDGADLVVARIPPNGGQLYQASGVFWQRRGTYTTPMTVEEVHAHLHTTGALAWERKVCPNATLDDLDPELLDGYLNLRDERSRNHLRQMPRDELLIRLHCAARDTDGQVRPTNAGVLMFGRDPSLLVPQNEVVCVRYGDSLGAEGTRTARISEGRLLRSSTRLLTSCAPTSARVPRSSDLRGSISPSTPMRRSARH
jgi:predicted HTH transcriptional regulator